MSDITNHSSLIRHPADRAQVGLAIIGPAALAFPFVVSLEPLAEIALWAFVWLTICRHNYILHNHVHRPFTRSKALNRVIGTMLGFCTGMTAGNWKITHVHGHHVDDKIESLPSRSYVRFFKVDENAAFTHLSAASHALRTAPLQWMVPTQIMLRESLRKKHFRRKFYRFYLLETLLVYGLVAGFVFSNPIKGFAYFLIFYSFVFIESRHVDYITHVSGRADSKYGFANVCIDPRYNGLLWNFGFHLAHHLKPSAHWTELPSIYRSLRLDEEPSSVAKTVNYFGAFSPPTFGWHRTMENGGARADSPGRL